MRNNLLNAAGPLAAPFVAPTDARPVARPVPAFGTPFASRFVSPVARLFTSLFIGLAAPLTAVHAQAPSYRIVSLGVLGSDTASQGFNVSPDGDTAVGRSLGATVRATGWTAAGGLVALPNLAGRTFAVANAVNNAGTAVGNSTTTSFGSGALPVAWNQGIATALALPGGQTVGRANDINGAGVIVGSVGGGSTEAAAVYRANGTALITAGTANGSTMRTAYGINDAGFVAGNGTDPSNAAVNVGLVWDSGSGAMTSVGALAGANGALAFDIGNGGHVVGSSMLNQGAGRPYIWTAAFGMVEIALPAGASQGSARGVNAAGWAVGTASGAFAVPFLYDGSQTYRLADLLPAQSGWNLSTTTSASAFGIADDGSIVGTAVLNGQTHAYAMFLAPVPEPGAAVLMLVGGALLGAIVRQRRSRTGRDGVDTDPADSIVAPVQRA